MNDTHAADDRAGLNEFLHTVVMGLCWHEDPVIRSGFGNVCEKCQTKYSCGYVHPQYTTSLDAVAAVERKVIETVGYSYRRILETVLVETLGEKVTVMSYPDVMAQMVTADALTRAKACRKAWEEHNDPTN